PVSRPDLKLPVAIEEEATLASRLARLSVDRVRVLGPASDVLRRGVHQANVTLDEEPLTTDGRVELLHWLREQAISETLHRFGTLTSRAHRR
ncbi:MAG: hypothetical protein ACLGHT_02530, partial [Acidimicrobiia bacterium]